MHSCRAKFVRYLLQAPKLSIAQSINRQSAILGIEFLAWGGSGFGVCLQTMRSTKLKLFAAKR
jgi:hypothetical protein